ncbi:hypothetical protein KQX54_012225 [Cotesia glomerata]|uniref:Uncharacterized protein n=1 Tax=Cotesia glomerata TaxID=32391 RepID=A0AAV7J3Q8_COTGL|nr:hypothetical protein KQX54_012225 [Cotesia glomerata]
MAVKCRKSIKTLLRSDSTQSYITEIRKKINPSLEMKLSLRCNQEALPRRISCKLSGDNNHVARQPNKECHRKIVLQENWKLEGTLWAFTIPVK